MQHTPSSAARSRLPDTPEVIEAERKVGAILEELEAKTDGEVRDLGLDDVVDTDADGQPVVKRVVDIALQRSSRRPWAR